MGDYTIAIPTRTTTNARSLPTGQSSHSPCRPNRKGRKNVFRSWAFVSFGISTSSSFSALLGWCPLEEFLEGHPDVGVVYKHLPLTAIHPAAMDAARAATCGDRQGEFLSVHQTLYESDHWMDDEDWGRIGKAAGVNDLERFLGCIRDRETDEVITADLQLAESLGLVATPSLVLRYGVQKGRVSSSFLADLLDADARREPKK